VCFDVATNRKTIQAAPGAIDDVQQWLVDYFDAVAQYEMARSASRIASQRVHAWEPLEAKAALVSSDNRELAARHRVEDLAAQTQVRLRWALQKDPGDARAREALADFCWFQLLEAEQDEQPKDAKTYHRLVAEYHDGKYARELAGVGTLTLQSSPPGAAVQLLRVVEEGFVRK
jgi:hypothetical protein